MLSTVYYLLAAPDRPYTAMSIPGGPSPQSTRMPMGAKASMAALYQAMIDTLGEAIYRYVCLLVCADVRHFANSSVI